MSRNIGIVKTYQHDVIRLPIFDHIQHRIPFQTAPLLIFIIAADKNYYQFSLVAVKRW